MSDRRGKKQLDTDEEGGGPTKKTKKKTKVTANHTPRGSVRACLVAIEIYLSRVVTAASVLSYIGAIVGHY